MELMRQKDGEDMPVQLWSLTMTWDKKDHSFPNFHKRFAARLRMLFVLDNPRVPSVLAELIRPNQFAKNLSIVHNWGDVIFYNVSTVIRLYGFRGIPFILPYQVPLRIGIAEFFRQLGDIEECALTGKSKGTFFPNVTIAHQFIIAKGGWVHMNKILAPYHMATAIARVADPKGFYNEMFRKKTKGAMINHIFNFPEDIVRNVAKLQEQEVRRKNGWCIRRHWILSDNLILDGIP